MDNNILEKFDFDIDNGNNTLWLATKPVLNIQTWFDTEQEVEEYFKSELVKRNNYIHSMSGDDISFTSFLDSFLPGITRYDYFVSLFGEDDVIVKSNLIYTNDGFVPTFVSVLTGSTYDNNIKVLKKKDDAYFWKEYFKINDLDIVYDKFAELRDIQNNGKSYTLSYNKNNS